MTKRPLGVADKRRLSRAGVARRLIRHGEPSVDERYAMLAVVVWGRRAHDVAAAVASMPRDELERRLRS